MRRCKRLTAIEPPPPACSGLPFARCAIVWNGWVSNETLAGRGLARRALAVELRRKGIGDEDAQVALATVDDDAEEASARDLLARRWRSGPGIDPAAQARRAAAMLGRKGYPPGLTARLVREMVDDRGAASWDPSPGDVD